MVSQSELETAIREKVQSVSAVVVSDVSGGCGQAYDVIIVSEAFDGLNTLKRHRMVNELLKEQIAQLHAFSQKTYTPQQYEQLSGPQASTPTSSTPTASAPAGASSVLPKTSVTPARPSTLDTSVAQRGAKVHHRSNSSNVSVPELILTPDAGDAKRGGSHGRQRSLTPNTLNDLVGGSSQGSPNSASSGISRLHYNAVTNVEFWVELRDFLERRLMRDDEGTSPGAPSATPSGRRRGEAELVKLFEDFFQTQKQHMSGKSSVRFKARRANVIQPSASDAARVRDGTGMFGM